SCPEYAHLSSDALEQEVACFLYKLKLLTETIGGTCCGCE
ncbi:MAG: hypothetical protein JWM16_6442, partial [Verrucomicrobiales bacterium]|nr:hypothetical protein [Verrucomicrobiales bacterium]